jgi:hypothetical protein
MTIQEAIRSGKPFKRKNFKSWIILFKPHPDDDEEFYIGLNPVTILPCAILADDWEIDTGSKPGSEDK